MELRQQANEAITNLIRSTEFKTCISKVKPEELQEDLAQEVALILLQMDPNKVVELSSNKQLTFWTVRIIMNQVYSESSPFHKKYRKHLHNIVEYKEEHTHGDDEGASQYSDDWNMTAYNKLMELNGIAKDHTIDVVARKKLEFKVFGDMGKTHWGLITESVLTWYEAEMVKLYLQVGDYRSMQSVTHIPYSSCAKTVNKAIDKIKKQLL